MRRVFALEDAVISCGGEAINLEIRTNPELDFYNQFTYSWTPIEGLSCVDCPNPTANPTTPTTYIVSADNGVNCSYLDTINVTVSNDPLPSIDEIQVTSPICMDDPPGSATAITSGGSGTLQFSWSNDSNVNTNSIDNLLAGTYSLTVTDQNGCFTEASFEIIAPMAGPVVQFDPVINIDCQGDSTGFYPGNR